MSKELPEETKARLAKKAIEDITIVTLLYGIKIENQTKKVIDLYKALYHAGVVAGATEMKNAYNEPIDPEDIPF